VFQVSLDQYRTLEDHFALGKELASLRQRGVSILGSGDLVHNLHRMNMGMNSQHIRGRRSSTRRSRRRLRNAIFGH
jgi:aromatic ring-opening dioxygenase catalytic subunit (LigB family)